MRWTLTTQIRGRAQILESMISKGTKQKRQSRLTLPFCTLTVYVFRYFLNFLLTPASPTGPRPRSSMVAGSGTRGSAGG